MSSIFLAILKGTLKAFQNDLMLLTGSLTNLATLSKQINL